MSWRVHPSEASSDGGGAPTRTSEAKVFFFFFSSLLRTITRLEIKIVTEKPRLER